MTSTPPTTVCARGVWDQSVPGIRFDRDGVSSYARLFDRLVAAYPRGPEGRERWLQIVASAKEAGRGRRYDCVIGVSGGTDSCYLLHLARELGLRPLAVNLDNGWASEIAVRNIRRVTSALDIDLETWVVDYEEMKDALRAYMRAGLPWIDCPTDMAIRACLYRTAGRERVGFVFRGNDFRSEGTQPREWTYGDARQLRHIQRRFGTRPLKTLPVMSTYRLAWYSLVGGIRQIYPYYYLDYTKAEARALLEREYGWQYYGGHHHENRFTKFAIVDWLPEKFGIDKRLITLSAQVLSGALDREESLAQLQSPASPREERLKERAFVLKKLGISEDEFATLLAAPNRSFLDYPSDYSRLQRLIRVAGPVAERLLSYKPMSLYQIEIRDSPDGRMESAATAADTAAAASQPVEARDNL